MIPAPASAKAGAGSRETDRASTCAKDLGSLGCLKGSLFGHDRLHDRVLWKNFCGERRVTM